MSAALFVQQLKEGNTSEAIKTLNLTLHEASAALIKESNLEVATSYGFTINEEDELKGEPEEDESEEDGDESEEDKKDK